MTDISGTSDLFDASASGASTLPKRVLLVDDAKIARIILSKKLENLGHAVTTADNGAEAVEFCKRSMPEVVLLDYDMPNMTGAQTAKEIRELGGEQPRVVVFSGSDLPLHRKESMAAGADGFFGCKNNKLDLDLVEMVSPRLIGGGSFEPQPA